jgi:esterase/lipase
MKWIKRLLLVIIIIALIYVLGPNPSTPTYSSKLPTVNFVGASLDSFVKAEEEALPVKDDNEARIVWQNDTTKAKTKYAIVYLHGFSASQEEGNAIHEYIANKFGCNLYLARLSVHGLKSTEELLDLTAENYWEAAKQALAIGKQIGEKVILLSTSTGGTQSLQLAASFPNEVEACVLMSPNIEINDPNAWLLNNPWGLQIARLVKGGNYNLVENCKLPEYAKYWNCKYRLEAVVQLQEMLETTMNSETFKKITCPVLTLGYYKDEANQDKVVKVTAMKKMVEQLSSTNKKFVAMPNVGNHVMGNPLLSKDVEGVKKEIDAFLITIIK